MARQAATVSAPGPHDADAETRVDGHRRVGERRRGGGEGVEAIPDGVGGRRDRVDLEGTARLAAPEAHEHRPGPVGSPSVRVGTRSRKDAGCARRGLPAQRALTVVPGGNLLQSRSQVALEPRALALRRSARAEP